MGKGGKHVNKKKKYVHKIGKKKNKNDTNINKKAIFNRYKNKQKVEDEIKKKKIMERKFQEEHVYSSGTEEEEENTFVKLVSCFENKVTHENDESEEESHSDNESLESSKDILSDTNMEENEDCDISDSDPFVRHLQFDLEEELLVSLSNNPPTVKKVTKSWPVLGNLCISIPEPLEIKPKSIKKPKVSIIEEKLYASTGTIPHKISNVDFEHLNIKSQIRGNIVSANKKNLIKKDLEISEIFTPLQKELFSVINNYQDLYYSERTLSNAEEIRYVYCLHVVNHMLKTRIKIIHHNAKLTKKGDMSDEYRDQGLVRPKVLIMVPFKDAAYRVVNTIIEILVPKEAGQVVNKNRFETDFTGGELILPKKNPKPEDYELLFSGNTEDTFRLGMTLTKKTLKLYTDFYSSDIIVASPLGLRMLVGAEGEEERDYDFLASIELLIMDQTDVFLLQNWEHLLHVLDHFHLQPKKTHGADFSRVRMWAVNGWSKYYRQSLMFSSVSLPEIRSIFNKKCQNYAGKVVVDNPPETGSIQQVVLQVPHIFHRFNSGNPLESVEARFQYFIKEILPKQRDPLMSHTLLYIPSYFDYVRIRNYFKKEDISFVQICEYSKDSKIARARDMFFHTEAHFLLYSERVHFFRRFRIKGIRHVIFYQPPTYPHFYSEICNLMQESNQNKFGGSNCNMSVSVLWCRLDAARLAAALGTSRAAKLLSATGSTHAYTTGDR